DDRSEKDQGEQRPFHAAQVTVRCIEHCRYNADQYETEQRCKCNRAEGCRPFPKPPLPLRCRGKPVPERKRREQSESHCIDLRNDMGCTVLTDCELHG